MPERPRPPRTYPTAYKLRVLEEYERLDKAGKGALLRREGLYPSLISEWRKQRDKGALAALQQRRGRPPVDPLQRELARLQAENNRRQTELGKAHKVIEVQGELSALLSRLAASSAEQQSSERTAGLEQGEGGGFSCGKSRCSHTIMANATAPPPRWSGSACSEPGWAGRWARQRCRCGWVGRPSL